MAKTSRISASVAKRFFRYCQQITKHGCWGWSGPTRADGYGRLYTGHRGQYMRAHRVSYELFIGAIPADRIVMHVCDNPVCANPLHLVLGTHRDNVHDAIAKGRARYQLPPLRRKLTADQVMTIRSGGANDHEFAKRFGVSHDAVRLARIGKTWAGLKVAPSPT